MMPPRANSTISSSSGPMISAQYSVNCDRTSSSTRNAMVPITGPNSEPMPPNTTITISSPERVQYIPAGLMICGALVILAFFITQPIIPLGFLLTRDSLAIALAIILIGFFTMIARKKAVTQVIGFLVMENGLFLGATAAAYGMPLIVELGVFFDVLVGALIIGIYSHRLQDAFDSVDTSKLTTLKE